jgi:hypothetical protein
MRKIILSTLILLCLVGSVAAQEKHLLSGRILQNSQSPAENATVSLLQASDSAVIKIEMTGKDGRFRFPGIDTGSYLLEITSTGFKKIISGPYQLNQTLEVPALQLLPEEKNLGAVTVTARKPLVEQKFDKLIFNVAGNVTAAGNSALEMLGKAPGVMVDGEGGISLSGRTGVLVIIDGKRTHLSSTDLAAYLRGLPASAIERIEIINNPSAQYEAEGTSGIIDIRLKKDEKLGYNGSVNLAYLHGTASSGNSSVNFNYRGKKLNLFGTLSALYDDVEGKQQTDRKFFKNDGSYNGLIHTDNKRHFTNKTGNLRVGADYYMNEKTVVGVLGMFARTNFTYDYFTRSNNYFTGDSSNYALNTSYGDNRRRNAAFNFNIKHSIDKKGKEWNFDVDYARYTNSELSDLRSNTFGKDNSSILPLYRLAGDMNGSIGVYSSRLDLQLPGAFKGSLQAGVRSSLVKTDNNLLFYNASSGTMVFDSGKSNHFLYSENINAGYVNYQRKIDKWNIQTGLRLENTNGKGEQVTTAQSFRRSYVQLFPNLFASYDFTKNYTMGLSVSRRIDRPSYNSLNPFRFYGSPDGYSEGNPFLNPQFTYIVELSHTFFQKYILRVGHRRTDDVISIVWGVDDVNPRISAQKNLNLSSVVRYNFNLTLPVNIGTKFTSFNNITGEYHKYEGEAFGTTLNRGTAWFLMSSNNTYRINPSLTLELNAAGRTSQLQGGFQRVVPAAAVSFGIGKRMLSGKGNLRFNVSDVFLTNVMHGVTSLNNYELHVKQWNETRRATLSFSYNFGKSKVAAARNRSSSSEEETRRVGN